MTCIDMSHHFTEVSFRLVGILFERVKGSIGPNTQAEVSLTPGTVG